MKKFSWFVLLVAALFMVGCGGRSINPDYSAYLETKVNIAKNAKPVFEVECPAQGCNFKRLAYYGNINEATALQQKAPSPAWRFAGQALKYGTMGFGIYAFGDIMETAIESAGSSYHNSFNEMGGSNYYAPTSVAAEGNIGDTSPWFGDDNTTEIDMRDSMNVEAPPIEEETILE